MANNPWSKDVKGNSNWSAPTQKRKAPALKKPEKGFDSKDDPKKSFTKNRSAGDAAKKFLGGGR